MRWDVNSSWTHQDVCVRARVCPQCCGAFLQSLCVIPVYVLQGPTWEIMQCTTGNKSRMHWAEKSMELKKWTNGFKIQFPKPALHSAGNAFFWMQQKLDFLRGHSDYNSRLVFLSISISQHKLYCTFKTEFIWMMLLNQILIWWLVFVCVYLFIQLHTDEFIHVSSEICVCAHACLWYCKSTHVNACVCVCMCLFVPLFSALQMLIYGFPNVCFFNLLHFKGAHGESWGASSIWALIEGETDKRRDKEREKN